MWVCWFGALSLTRGQICHLQLLLALASTVILGSKSRGTRNHILLSQIWDFPFRHLLRLAGLQWRYSTPPPHGSHSYESIMSFMTWCDRRQNTMSYSSSVILQFCCHGNSLLREQCLPSSCLATDVFAVLLWLRTSGFQASCQSTVLLRKLELNLMKSSRSKINSHTIMTKPTMKQHWDIPYT
jgi:hypothetical protein